ncbi:riboflavin biosynthesis protein RibD C-terminal domain protein [Leptospira broomii serovar Hurstbridge str. 5399]|uniref:Riboflavin biosynthesis protein RibD C-terminal domain protein n=1 Tax=Leptospira broomii serovar Hurstbridge str. 5399 TaxID=1049789 RepID=T0FC31_9LEPT|nr:dihydrofolate reductase family protein [Leptospira broomii]EQA45122.1 riboflavin biosynthesis protein RibD C-terminal domain protein [Leptospira broomii serovar Hurstbridge str. 5399]
MRKLIVSEWLTLDGIMQSPGFPGEDTEGGFKQGGWQGPYFDEVFSEVVAKTVTSADALLLGRKTYDIFAAYWPAHPDEWVARNLNSMAKYVVSKNGAILTWENSILIQGEVPAKVAGLKEQVGNDILVIGSGELVRVLAQNDLVDEYQIMISPLSLGAGKRLFKEDNRKQTFALISSAVTSKGVLILKYGVKP